MGVTRMERQPIGESSQSELFGLVLAGGDSSRMGADKGVIDYHGVPQARYLHGVLTRVCGHAFVSINPGQQAMEPYASLPVVIDSLPRKGPASGVLAAARARPAIAWLVVAVDLAALTAATLSALARARRPGAAATAFRHSDGTLEPLCAIWEPAACAALAKRVAAGDFSPRRCLESADTEIVACPDAATLRSFDTRAGSGGSVPGD